MNALRKMSKYCDEIILNEKIHHSLDEVSSIAETRKKRDTAVEIPQTAVTHNYRSGMTNSNTINHLIPLNSKFLLNLCYLLQC